MFKVREASEKREESSRNNCIFEAWSMLSAKQRRHKKHPDPECSFSSNSCFVNGQVPAATNYCEMCRQCYCNEGLAGHMKLFPEHHVLDKNQSMKRKDKMMIPPPERCIKHQDEIVDMYCSNHGSLCCSVCVSLKHKSCHGLKPITLVIKGTKLRKEIKETKKQVKSIFEKLSQCTKVKSQHKKFLEKHYQEVLSEIKVFRNKINETIDNIEENTFQKLKQIFAKQTDDVSIYEEACNRLMEDIQKLNEHLSSVDEVSDTQTFIEHKLCQQKIAEAEKLVLENVSSKWNVNFVADQHVLDYISVIEHLGRFNEISQSKSSSRNNNNSYIYRVKGKQEYNAKIENDKNENCIWGCCTLPDGAVLIADGNNKRLKRLNDKFQVTDYCNLPAKPNDVCSINRNEAAVALCNNTIQFVKLTTKIELTRSIKLNHTCRSLAYSNDQLYVVDNIIYIYTIDGQHKNSLYMNNNREAKLQCIAVKNDGSKIYVTDWERGMITLDNIGRQLAIFSDPELKGATGICLDGDDNVFVAGGGSNTIIQVDGNGQKKIGAKMSDQYGTDHALSLISTNDGITHPRSLSFNPLICGLMVGRYCNKLTMVELE